MRFALIDNIRVEAQPKQHGFCPCCSKPVIAKCGKQKVWHWAHRDTTACDRWWETETEWHRAWKNNYPSEWQEVLLPDEKTGEKHIADIRTVHNLVLEFQHSHIDPEERTSREKFYQNMIWVIDGTRLKRDYPRFRKGLEKSKRTNTPGYFFIDFPDEVFPKDWLGSSVPVVFDFCGFASQEDSRDVIKNLLWCLRPERIEGYAVVVGIRREDFINVTKSRAQLFLKPSAEQRQPPPMQQPQVNPTIRRRESSYYYDRYKDRFVKRVRL